MNDIWLGQMPDVPHDPRVRELLTQLDQITRESRSIQDRIRDLRGRSPEWPARGRVADLFKRDLPPSGVNTPEPGDDERG